jgi:hypothetical protein
VKKLEKRERRDVSDILFLLFMLMLMTYIRPIPSASPSTYASTCYRSSCTPHRTPTDREEVQLNRTAEDDSGVQTINEPDRVHRKQAVRRITHKINHIFFVTFYLKININIVFHAQSRPWSSHDPSHDPWHLPHHAIPYPPTHSILE